MAKGFIGAASKKNADIRQFLKEAAGGTSLKYSAEKAMKHFLYVPYTESVVADENGNETKVKEIISISAAVHEWNGSDGYYHSTVCINGVVRNDEADPTKVLNDGTCPFCERVRDAWEIFNIRKETEERTCGKTGAELEQYMKNITSKLSDERKAKAARDYIYILVAKFRQDKGGSLVLNQTTRMPDFELKVMKLSTSRAEKIVKTVETSGIELAGTEIVFDYPDTDDVRHLSTDCVTVPIMHGSNNSVIAKYPGLEDEILRQARLFTWDGLEKAFPEWRGMTTAEAQITMNKMFKQYDDWKKELETNPNARYMEYLTAGATATPALGIGTAAPAATQEPNLQMPTVNPVDVNDAFSGVGSL